MRFNAISEFEFTFPKSIDGGITNIEAYDYLRIKRLVLVENYGYFLITNVEDDLKGSVPIRIVSCQSLEVELIQKRVTAYGGTKKLYDPLSPEDTILYDMLQLAPNWSAGDVDTELLVLYRTFNVSDTTVYEFLMSDVGKAFECVFIFDTVTRTISAKTIANATIDTDIFLSFDNLIKDATFSEKSDEITTCLSVYGGGNLDIHSVNPLGSVKIYDFSYYANVDWMSQELVDAISIWEDLITTSQVNYSAHLLELETANSDLLDLQNDLATLNEEFLALQGVQNARISDGMSYDDITTQMVAKQAEIDSQNILITNKETQITDITTTLTDINTQVSFAQNFTSDQLLELDNFIYENTYKNENIIQTDTMTLVEIQQAAQDLYDQGQVILARIAQPRYEISLNAVNYIALREFYTFTSQTELGCVVTAEVEDGVYIETVLLEIYTNINDPTDFKMTYSNRVRLDNQDFTYSDLVGQIVKTGSAVSFDSLKWADWTNNSKDNVTTFIESALNTTTNNLISNSNEEIIINQNGLRGRHYNTTTGLYDDTQVWLTNSVLAFTDDNWSTAKLALGKVTVSGTDYFGLVADVIVGRLLAGNSLTITNENNNFTLDANGAILNNAKFTLATTNTKIFINPTSDIAFRIQKNEGGTFNDKFWVDNTGNVNFTGNLSGATGTFSGTLAATIGNIGLLLSMPLV